MSGCASVATGEGEDFNARVLAAVKTMPQGGGYDGSDATKNRLPKACAVADGIWTIDARVARPSFCSGATYLVLLRALGSGPTSLFPVVDHQDGHGVFGRWNANGPGAAKLVADLAAGVNFTSWEQARPGDFLKIWWTEAIGGRERGHHVVYLGHTADSVRFWSSNQPGGYGVKTVPRDDCKRVLFTRITTPERFLQAGKLPEVDPWLVKMLREDFTWDEVVTRCRVRE
ncbi:hypothetical protein HNR46_001717 [Haloferula luteola]|uniref:Uncharacterized protein n=1 Tax=Haloferula luteola TaxID=595692 RepID=A0A840VC29_9BACT|nr:hypothetical protein [Haloferula luteola]MBB5351480.1 hypothetical protein [Haloferula luteola]